MSDIRPGADLVSFVNMKGRRVWIKPKEVASFLETDGGNTFVYMITGERFHIAEPPEQVAAKLRRKPESVTAEGEPR